MDFSGGPPGRPPAFSSSRESPQASGVNDPVLALLVYLEVGVVTSMVISPPNMGYNYSCLT